MRTSFIWSHFQLKSFDFRFNSDLHYSANESDKKQIFFLVFLWNCSHLTYQWKISLRWEWLKTLEVRGLLHNRQASLFFPIGCSSTRGNCYRFVSKLGIWMEARTKKPRTQEAAVAAASRQSPFLCCPCSCWAVVEGRTGSL